MMYKSKNGVRHCECLSSVVHVELLEDRHLLSAGQLDPSFGTGGIANLSWPTGQAIAISASGDTISVLSASSGGWVVGSVDDPGRESTFTQGPTLGTLPERFPVQMGPTALALEAGGAVAVGNVSVETGLVDEVMPTVEIFTYFGLQLVREVALPRDAFANSVAIQQDGKIIIAGWTYDGSGGGIDALLIRLLPTGVLDPTFGKDGVVMSRFYGTDNEFNKVLIQPDGKILATGFTKSLSGYPSATAKTAVPEG